MGTGKGIAKRGDRRRMKEEETERGGREILLILFILLSIQKYLRGSYLLLGFPGTTSRCQKKNNNSLTRVFVG